MIYEHMIKGIFLSRPNRFIAHVMIPADSTKDGFPQTEVICHVKNTGRCKELLLPGVTVLVQFHPEAARKGRKTAYSLIGVYKECIEKTLLINMDSQAPNQVAWEWLKDMEFTGISAFSEESVSHIRREVSYGKSRFDLAFDLGSRPAYMEVKGVTLEENGIAMFPDAPTERGVKHMTELTRAVKEGYEAYILFVIQMKGMRRFCPNQKTHPAFGDALAAARDGDVHILAYDCLVTEDSLTIDAKVPVRLP